MDYFGFPSHAECKTVSELHCGDMMRMMRVVLYAAMTGIGVFVADLREVRRGCAEITSACG